jgi:hypothetical protein
MLNRKSINSSTKGNELYFFFGPWNKIDSMIQQFCQVMKKKVLKEALQSVVYYFKK